MTSLEVWSKIDFLPLSRGDHSIILEKTSGVPEIGVRSGSIRPSFDPIVEGVGG
jgi:hypothetical protein